MTRRSPAPNLVEAGVPDRPPLTAIDRQPDTRARLPEYRTFANEGITRKKVLYGDE